MNDFRNPYGRQPTRREQFGNLNATELYCPCCRRAMPVRSHLLLVLPEGDKYEYRCARCGTTVGEKMDRGAAGQNRLIV